MAGGFIRASLRAALATLAVVAVTFLLAWLGADAAMAAVIFLSVVVAFAAKAGIRLSVWVTLLGALLFDFYFLPPYGSLRLEGPQEWLTLAFFLICSLVVGRVAEMGRREARRAEARRADVERLYTLAQETMLHDSPASLIGQLPQTIARIFDLDAVLLYVRDDDRLHAVGEVLPMGVAASMQAVAEGLASQVAIPGGLTAQPLLLGMRSLGSLAFRSGRLSREVAAAVSAQVAVQLARAAAVEAHSRVEAARESDRLRTALVDSLTHELRTPLTSIRAAASTLHSGAEVDAAIVADLAAVVDEEAARLDRLIGQAVEIAQIDANLIRVELSQEYPRVLLEQAVVALRDGGLLGRRVHIAVEEPDRTASFDRQLLGHVLRHLLENAVRYSPPGGRIALRSRRAAERLEFEVEDEGPGVHPADLPYIFEKFYRGKKRQAAGKGTGMGLAIARSILRAHGGGIEVVPATGRGACFRFWVPLVESDRK